MAKLVGHRRGLQHVHQIGEALRFAIMRGSRSHDQRIACTRQQHGQPVPLVLIGHMMALVDHYNIPSALFQIGPIAAI